MTVPDSANRASRRLPKLHAVTDDAVLARPGWVDGAVRVVLAGGPRLALHLRGRHTSVRMLLGFAEALAPHAARSGAALFINDRVDIALASNADGVHLGRGSLPASETRALLGENSWVGVSLHGPSGTEDVATEGADYAFLGTIHPTASHPGQKGMGAAGLADVVRRCGSFPIVGIGGIGPEDVDAIVGAGAYGVAAIRGIWSAGDPAAAVNEYLEGFGKE